MSHDDYLPPRPVAPPARCTCGTRHVAATLAETLTCPFGWYEQPDGTWVHTWRLRAGAS